MNFKYLLPKLLSLLLLTVSLQAQTKSNLEVFYSLLDSSIYEIKNMLAEKSEISNLKINLGKEYSIFHNYIVSGLSPEGIIINRNTDSAPELSYVIETANVEYYKMERRGLFGDYFVERKIIVQGNYLIHPGHHGMKRFSFSQIDSVDVSEIQKIENYSYPFTRGELPAEPFFPGLIEPIIAIGTAAIAIILFFTVRSK